MSLATIKDHAEVVMPNTDDAPLDEWLAKRRLGIGGSDAAAALGLSKWDSQYSLWADKVGIKPPIDDTNPMKWGRRLEQAIGYGFAEDTGTPVTRYPVMFRSLEWPWMQTNLDFITQDAEKAVEVKNVGGFRVSDWEDGAVPPHYALQGQHELAVTGLSSVIFAVLVGGNDPRYIEVERDDDLIGELVIREKAFWDLVESNTEPAVDGMDATTLALKSRYADPEIGSSVELQPKLIEPLIERRKHLKAEAKYLDGELHQVENEIKALLGDYEIGTVNNITVVTWKKIDRAGYTVEDTSYRKLHVPTTKGAS
jgi:putative phage-type endonuclease